MNKFILMALCLLSISVYAQKHINTRLKKQLDSVMLLDQKYRDTLTLLMTPDKADSVAKAWGMKAQVATSHYWKLQNAIDSTNTLVVEAIFRKYGYPGKTVVGDSTNEVACYIIQHSKKISNYIPLIKKAADEHELSFKLYAMMLDRYLMNKDQEQIYGTQMTMRYIKTTKQNEWVVWPIKDPQNVNQLRKKAGFKDTVEENAKRMDIKYRVIKLDEMQL